MPNIIMKGLQGGQDILYGVGGGGEKKGHLDHSGVAIHLDSFLKVQYNKDRRYRP